jgi:hypothetical protein
MIAESLTPNNQYYYSESLTPAIQYYYSSCYRSTRTGLLKQSWHARAHNDSQD